MKRYFDTVIGLIFPNLCYACREYEPLNNHLFCLSCQNRLPFVSSGGDAYAALEGKDYFPEEISDFSTLFYFTKDSYVAEIIHRIKYEGQYRMAKKLGVLLAQMTLLNQDLRKYVIVPVPIHKKRRKERGYNQAEEIAKGFASVKDIPIISDYLIRTKHDKSQTAKDKRERSEALKNSFAINEGCDRLSHIILIDDVITTGSTISACYTQLEKKSPVKVIVASLGVSI